MDVLINKVIHILFMTLYIFFSLLAFDLKSLRPIKHKEPYESKDQYLDINYRLLREECFRGLCDGIQNFLEHENCDSRSMKMYR